MELVLRQGEERLEQWRFMPVMSIDKALERRQAIVQATQQLMKEGVDYGKIPGAGDKPALLQPGADKLCNLFGLVIRYEVTKCEEDWTGETHGGTSFFFYEMKGRAYRQIGDVDYLMGEGIGSCNSWESKYKYRKGERLCPNCGKANIRKSRDGGWYCWLKTEGCGATFRDGDARVESQEVGRKINPDMADIVNTVLKMAQKRSKVSTTINATSASEFFTQDVEDNSAKVAEDPGPHGFTVDVGPNRYGPREAQECVRDTKVAEAGRMNGAGKPHLPAPRLSNKGSDIKAAFAQVRERLGEVRYLEELQIAGIVREVFELRQLDRIQSLYDRLWVIAELTAERAA
jgi:ribosomal protein L37AE/L43A